MSYPSAQNAIISLEKAGILTELLMSADRIPKNIADIFQTKEVGAYDRIAA